MPSPHVARCAISFTLLTAGLGAFAGPAQARADGDRAAAEAALSEARAALAGRGGPRDITALLHELAISRSALSKEDRERADDLLKRPTDPRSPQDEESGALYAVAEEEPLCSERFCIHYVAETEDAPDLADEGGREGMPDYVERVLEVFEEVHDAENETLGWPEPPSDGELGGGAELDVYLADIGEQGTYGYVAPDPDQANQDSQHSYQVMDNDYDEFNGDESLRVTAAHEYHHVLQYGINAQSDAWWGETTATWMEEQVYPAVNDYFQYLETWAQNVGTPLTTFSDNGPLENYQYGSAVWDHYVAALHEPAAIRDVWTQSEPGEDAPSSYDRVLAARGSSFLETFTAFGAAVAEWRAARSVFPDVGSYPDARRSGTLTVDGPAATLDLDHASFDLRDVAGRTDRTIRLEVTFPAGVAGGAVLVGGPGAGGGEGDLAAQLGLAPEGGTVSVEFPNPGAQPRLTAVLTNGDIDHGEFDEEAEDWDWSDDDVPVTVRVVTVGGPQDPGPQNPGPQNPGPQNPGPQNPGPVVPQQPVVPADVTGPLVRVPTANRSRRATRGGVVSFTVGPMLENTSGVLSLKTDKRIRVGSRRRVVTLGSSAFQVLRGQTGTVKIRLSKRVRRILRRAKRLRIQATITARDAAGNSTVRTYRFTVRAPRR